MIHDFMRVLVDGIGYAIGRNQDLIVANLGQAKAWVTSAPTDVTSLGG